MITINRIFTIFTWAILSAGGLAIPSLAADAPRRVVVEEVPDIKPIKHVSASQTHSGFPVPRYVSLKFNRVNGRQGPSLQHPALWQYRRQGMPLIVVAEMDIWRKVRDINGDESWLRTQALSGTRNAIMLEDSVLRSRPKTDSQVKAVAAKDALLNIIECKDDDWCRVKSETGPNGWVKRDKLWGASPL